MGVKRLDTQPAQAARPQHESLNLPNIKGGSHRAPQQGTREAIFQTMSSVGNLNIEPDLPLDMQKADGTFKDPLEVAAELAAQPAPAAPAEKAKRSRSKKQAQNPSLPVDDQAKVITSGRSTPPQDLTQPPVNKAPSSRAELQQQNQLANMPHPSIEDIFKGRSKEVVLGGVAPKVIVPPRQPQTAPVQRIEHVVEHKFPEMASAYVVVQSFGAYLGNGIFHNFIKDEIIYDVSVIDALLAGHTDKIKPFQEAVDFIQCPACAHAGPKSVFRPVVQ